MDYAILTLGVLNAICVIRNIKRDEIIPGVISAFAAGICLMYTLMRLA